MPKDRSFRSPSISEETRNWDRGPPTHYNSSGARDVTGLGIIETKKPKKGERPWGVHNSKFEKKDYERSARFKLDVWNSRSVAIGARNRHLGPMLVRGYLAHKIYKF